MNIMKKILLLIICCLGLMGCERENIIFANTNYVVAKVNDSIVAVIPSQYGSKEEWDEELETMIQAFEYYLKDPFSVNAEERERQEYAHKIAEKFKEMMNADEKGIC